MNDSSFRQFVVELVERIDSPLLHVIVVHVIEVTGTGMSQGDLCLALVVLKRYRY